MLGFRLARHSVLMVLRNLGPLARIAAPSIAGYLLLNGLIWTLLGIDPNWTGDTAETADLGARFAATWPALLLAAVASTIAGLWSVVGWHRYVLLEAQPQAFWIAVPGNRLLAYFGKAVLLFLALIVVVMIAAIAIAIPLVIGRVLTAGGADTSLGALELALVVVFSVFIGAAVYVVLARLSLILPAAAIGKPIGLGASLRATSGANWAIFLSGLLVTLAAIIAEVPAGLIVAELPPLLAILLAAPFYTLLSFFYISYMTTLYGVFVEKRELT